MNLGVVYGKPVIDAHDDPRIRYINDFIARLVHAAFPGAHYVEYFTWMKVSSARFKCKETTSDLYCTVPAEDGR